MEELVIFTAPHEDGEPDSEPVIVSRNGVTYTIMRGVPTRIPRGVADILENAYKIRNLTPHLPVRGDCDCAGGERNSGVYVGESEPTDDSTIWLNPAGDALPIKIGENGNWYIGDVDTGKPSRGEKGESGDTPENLFVFENGNAYVSLLSKNSASTNYVSITDETYGHKDTDNNYYVFSGGTQNYGITGAMPTQLSAGNYRFSAEIYIPSGNTTRTKIQFGACTFPADSDGVYAQRNTFDLASHDKWVKVEKIVSVTTAHTAVYISPASYIESYPFYMRNIEVISLEPKLTGWEGKKWVVVGDSITEHNNKALKSYHDYIAEKTGIAVVNMGLSGSGYKAKESDNGAFYQRVSNVPTDADVITIFGSGNDLDGSYQIGEASDTGTETLCGCINTTIDNLFTAFPTAQLGIITSIPWGGFNPSDDTNLMAQYSAKIAEICRRRGIPCLDLYHCSGLRPWDNAFQAVMYPANSSGTGYDSVHPNEIGHAFFAPKIKAFLDSLVL